MYNKAIGATVGAIFAWLGVFGIEALFGLDAGAIETFAVMVGSVLGTVFGKKNADPVA